MIMVSSVARRSREEEAVAVVVTVAKGYDLGYMWKNQGQQEQERADPPNWSVILWLAWPGKLRPIEHYEYVFH